MPFSSYQASFCVIRESCRIGIHSCSESSAVKIGGALIPPQLFKQIYKKCRRQIGLPKLTSFDCSICHCTTCFGEAVWILKSELLWLQNNGPITRWSISTTRNVLPKYDTQINMRIERIFKMSVSWKLYKAAYERGKKLTLLEAWRESQLHYVLLRGATNAI